MRENVEFVPNIEKTISKNPNEEEVQHLDDKQNASQ